MHPWISLGVSLVSLILAVGGSTILIVSRITVLETEMKIMKGIIEQYRTEFVPRKECDLRDEAMIQRVSAIEARIKYLEENRG